MALYKLQEFLSLVYVLCGMLMMMICFMTDPLNFLITNLAVLLMGVITLVISTLTIEQQKKITIPALSFGVAVYMTLVFAALI